MQCPDLPLLLCKEVASVLGIGEATIARVVAEYNSGKNQSAQSEECKGVQAKALIIMLLISYTGLLCQTFLVLHSQHVYYDKN